jgi:zinc/manganese transport system substrate-binding protein
MKTLKIGQNMLRLKGLILFSIFAITLAHANVASAKLKVVTTTSDLGALAKAVGQDEVDVLAIGKGTQDPHQIDAKPSFMVKMRDAQLVLAQGLELETAWIGPLIQGSRNPKINMGSKGYLELGDKLSPIEIPSASATRAEGDVHPGGNPHFQLDPIRMGQAALIVADRMGELDAANKDLYLKNAKAFQKNLEEKTKIWKARIEKTGIKEIVTYHKTLSYFFDRFGITPGPQLEPKPGIPPTASHILEVIKDMKDRKISLVFIENLYDDTSAGKLKESVPGVKVITVPIAVGGASGVESTELLIEKLVSLMEKNK